MNAAVDRIKEHYGIERITASLRNHGAKYSMLGAARTSRETFGVPPCQARERLVPARCADEIHLLDESAARVFEPKENHSRHHVIHIGGAERAGPAHFGALCAADSNQIDITLAVDLAAAKANAQKLVLF